MVAKLVNHSNPKAALSKQSVVCPDFDFEVKGLASDWLLAIASNSPHFSEVIKLYDSYDLSLAVTLTRKKAWKLST